MTSAVFSAGIGNVEAVDVILSGTSATDIVAVDYPTTVVNVHVANIDTSTAYPVTIEVYDVVNATSHYLLVQKNVAAKDCIDLAVGPLPSKWKLRATAGTGGKLHVRAIFTLRAG